MPKASTKTTKVTLKKGKLSMPKKVMPENGNDELLILEQNKSLGLLLLPVLIASSQSNFLSPKVTAINVITLLLLHLKHLFASFWSPSTKSSMMVPMTARAFMSSWLQLTKSSTTLLTTARKLSLDSFSTMKPNTKLPTYEINCFNSVAIFAQCKKYLKVNENPPSSQKAQLSFLLNQFQATDTKFAFANAIGKVGSEAQTIFNPLPLC
jgi:hypothetical protein